mgnify:CR=1 FL=1
MLSRRRFLQMCGVSLAAMAVGVPVVAAAGSIPVLLYHRIGDSDDKITEIGRVDNVMEEYHAIFAERMIQHPAVQRICNRDYSALFTPPAI